MPTMAYPDSFSQYIFCMVVKSLILSLRSHKIVLLVATRASCQPAVARVLTLELTTEQTQAVSGVMDPLSVRDMHALRCHRLVVIVILILFLEKPHQWTLSRDQSMRW
jgi:hypothetical protein